MHASSVVVSGKAILFLGHSNAGKSTISQLLSVRYPILADDKVLVFKRNGIWMVKGVVGKFCIWNENGDFVDPNEYPLSEIIRIFQADSVRLSRISSKIACKHLADSIFENDFQRNENDQLKVKKWFKMAAELSKEINGWNLTFSKNKTIINTISMRLEKNIVKQNKLKTERK